MKRREFLKKTSLLAASAAFVRPLIQSAEAQSAIKYDFIIVGAGAAGSIVVRRLVDRFPDKSILLIEAGGPTSKLVGGDDFPPYENVAQNATIFDVPGEYQNIAYQPKGDPYKQKETPFTYQGMGFGGNTQFNGMLFQAAPPFDFEKWPQGWKYEDMRPYFERVLQEMAVSNTPSTDGDFYNNGSAEITGDIYRANGFDEVDTSVLGGLGNRYFSRPYVVSEDGFRGGPVQSHLADIIGNDGISTRPNLDIIPFAKVERIIFDRRHSTRAVGIEYVESEQARFVPLAKGGRVVLAAGALMTPRLLLLSGVGPFRKHDQIFDDSFSVPFHIDNPGIGTTLFDHIGTMLTYEYEGKYPSYRAYHYDNYEANKADLLKYVTDYQSGPYAQYGPVSVMHHYVAERSRGQAARHRGRSMRQPNVEIFVNPFGVGEPGGTYNGSNNFSAYAMLLRPKRKAVMKINRDTFVEYPPLYLTDKKDLKLMALSIQQLLFLYRENSDLVLKFGPGGSSHPNLDPGNLEDVEEYVQASDPTDGIYYTRLIMNHWGGSCPLVNGRRKGTDPDTLLVKGTKNIHVVDASLHPEPLSAHPVATIMAVAEKASDILSAC